MSKIEDGGPAFPFGQVSEQTGMPINGYHNDGMTLRQYAAIKLRVPNSGTDWLDEMIRTSLRDDLAAKAMQGMAGSHGYCERGWDQKTCPDRRMSLPTPRLLHGGKRNEHSRQPVDRLC